MLWIVNMGEAANPFGIGPASPPAGTSGGKRRRFLVHIDGQDFPVDSPSHAVALLDRAREIAEAHAEKVASETVSRETNRVRPVRFPVPDISTPDLELRDVVQTASEAIRETYRTAAIDTELALLMARQLSDEDDEDALLLLM